MIESKSIVLPITPRSKIVLEVGIEPTRPNGQGILSPLRLPIPPSEHPI